MKDGRFPKRARTKAAPQASILYHFRCPLDHERQSQNQQNLAPTVSPALRDRQIDRLLETVC